METDRIVRTLVKGSNAEEKGSGESIPHSGEERASSHRFREGCRGIPFSLRILYEKKKFPTPNNFFVKKT
jgi:hypothetical protein